MMKRVLCCLLIVSFIFISGTALATTEKEILFRGIEWGLSASEVIDSLNNDLPSNWLEYYKMNSCTSQFYIENARPYLDKIVDEYEYKTSTVYRGTIKLTVAGHKVKEAYLVFARLFDSDREEAFYRALYYIEATKDVSQELESKLTGLYGDPDMVVDNSDLYYHYTNLAWKGANNTFCSLRTADWGGSKAKITLSYGTFEGDEWAKHADEILAELEKQKEEEQKNNPEGL